MRRRSAWKIENYTYRECPHPDREFGYAVSLHNHSCHSVEKLAALNQVVKLAFMRPWSGSSAEGVWPRWRCRAELCRDHF